MPKVYDFDSDQTECEDCGTDLIPVSYRGLTKVCPECVPDGLVEAYGFSEL
jgi:hypothetical protein